MRRFALAFLLTAAVACSSGTDGLTIVVSSPGTIGVGPQRVLLAVLDEETNQPRQAPEAGVEAVFTFGGSDRGSVTADWIWAIDGVRGFYVAEFDFDQPGNWSARLEMEDGRRTAEAPITVSADVAVVEVGEPAIPSQTPTYPAFPFEAITTDPSPDPSFYSLSVAEAVSSGRPAVIVFATPAFCSSAVCGPTLDLLKSAAPSYPGVEFVHVEVYENLDTPEALTIVQSVVDWGLPTEPWVFVTDRNGVVAARFEGALGLAELEEALAGVGA